MRELLNIFIVWLVACLALGLFIWADIAGERYKNK